MARLLLGGTVDPTTHERTGTDGEHLAELTTETFTTHGVIVGMTGSGKTGLGVVLIEEVLRAGLPALLIDPKGDLTNLVLTFPGLAAGDFEPWVDPGQAQAAGQSPADFAAAQAALWTKGLAGWNLAGTDIAALRAATDFTIYTPGSRSGMPLNIVGSLQAPASRDGELDDEIVGDEIEGYVSGLLALVGIDADPLSSREHILLSNVIHHVWSQGKSLDLPTLVGMIGDPPIRKLGVFELDQFFPHADRMKLAMQLNGLLASPSFAAWAQGPALDIQSMLYTPDGRGRCAIVTTAHLSDDERQFVTSLVLAKLVTWMRRQSGTTDLRALLYMDEVAGYLPPTANPPSKKPIMTLMKQARAFGVGVVLSTQNPVDIDYKAMSNAGTWMIGRLSTERDKARLLEGLRSAAGGVDIGAVDQTISGLGKREFVLRVPGKDTTRVITSRWAMSYLRGPMTRDQIAQVTQATKVVSTGSTTLEGPVVEPVETATPTAAATPHTSAPVDLAHDETTVMPEVAAGAVVRWVDPASPWLAEVGGSSTTDRYEAAAIARVLLRYDEEKADLVHDEEYECVVYPLSEATDASRAVAVDYDDRDLRATAPEGIVYRLPRAPIKNKTFLSGIERDLKDHLVRARSIEVPYNANLKLYGRPGETAEQFEVRCLQAADAKADEQLAKLKDTYATKLKRLREQQATAADRVDVLEEEARGKRNSELLSTAGSILGGLFSGRKSNALGKLGTAAGRRGRTNAAKQRVTAAEGKVARIEEQIAELDDQLADDVADIDAAWMAKAKQVTTLQIGLERADVKVAELALAWLPVD
ncbi:MAG TPA: helicase HerA-like domain-containing protein [Ilumatobacter sp.]|nr:helicase HerA-like domain-containing protein [Ilumatobacter sp.]